MMISDAELTVSMEAAVDANHRRARAAQPEVALALETPIRRDMPTWACALWCVAAAIIAVACLVYAAG